MSKLALSLILCSVLVSMVQSSKILMLPLQQMSHITSMIIIGEELIDRGHEVYMVLFENFAKAVPSKTKVKFLEYIESHTNVSAEEVVEKFSRNLLKNKQTYTSLVDQIKSDKLHFTVEPEHFENSYTSLLAIGFDIAVIDIMFVSKSHLLVPHRLGIPWISYTDYPYPAIMRVPWLPSFVPDQFSGLTDKMNLLERLRNTWSTIYMHYIAEELEVSEDVLEKYQQYGQFSSLDDLFGRSSLFFLTTDITLDYIKPTAPNIIQIGGLTTRLPRPLPSDLDEFMNGAEKGVVYVSFGTMVSNMSLALGNKFTSAFARLKGYRVLWRLESTGNITIPQNVKTAKWLPQNDVLGHAKTSLFITHCGNNGQFEAMFHKVPMLGFPYMGDQYYNAIRLQHKGYGVVMDMLDFTSDQLLDNINKILNDPGYRQRVTFASNVFRSAPETPSQRAAYWIEHVLHFGADHLRSAAQDLSFHQYLMIDILFVFFCTTVAVMMVVTKILCVVVRLIRRSEKMKQN